jgi:hypothetical protein
MGHPSSFYASEIKAEIAQVAGQSDHHNAGQICRLHSALDAQSTEA